MSRPAQATPARPAALVLALSLGVTTLSLLQTLVVPVLAAIAEQLRVSPGAAGWVLTANLLAAAVLTPVLGRLGDLRGERPVILGILVAVALGTLLAIVATSLPWLRVGRILQGASYGLFPLSISVLRRELPAARLTVAMSVVSSTLAVGGVIGLVGTGLLAGDGADYRRPFWIGLAVTVLSLGLSALVCPSGRRPRPAGWTGGVPSCSAPAWCCSSCPSRRATPGAGPLPRCSAASPRRPSRSPAGSSSSGGRRNRSSARRCSPTGAPSSRTSPAS